MEHPFPNDAQHDNLEFIVQDMDDDQALVIAQKMHEVQERHAVEHGLKPEDMHIVLWSEVPQQAKDFQKAVLKDTFSIRYNKEFTEAVLVVKS